MKQVDLKNQTSQLNVFESVLSESKFVRSCLENMYMQDITLSGTKIMDANLSNIEIVGAQLGGAYIHKIGVPPPGHPLYNPDAIQGPIRFEDCDFGHSTFINCNLSGIELQDCIIEGMKINGIPVEELMTKYYGTT